MAQVLLGRYSPYVQTAWKKGRPQKRHHCVLTCRGVSKELTPTSSTSGTSLSWMNARVCSTAKSACSNGCSEEPTVNTPLPKGCNVTTCRNSTRSPAHPTPVHVYYVFISGRKGFSSRLTGTRIALPVIALLSQVTTYLPSRLPSLPMPARSCPPASGMCSQVS